MGQFNVAFTTSGGNQTSFNLFEPRFLKLIDLSSVATAKSVFADTYFPDVTYFNTGRGKGLFPPTYACLGSGSAVLNLDDGSKALSWVAFHDTKDHHVNFWVWGWPEGAANPDWSKQLGTAHTLPE